MKLKQFLKENESVEFEYLEKFRDEVGDAIANAVKLFGSKGYKIVEYSEEPDSETEFGIIMTNKILDMWLAVTIQPGQDTGSEEYMFDFNLSVADQLSIGGGKTVPTLIANIGSSAAIKTSNELANAIEKDSKKVFGISEHVVDWYFDVSGEYGKVKMYVDKTGSFNKQHIRAVAGDFWIGTGEFGEGEVY